MVKYFALAVIVFLFFQTPFYKTSVVPQYTKFEAAVSKMFAVNPANIKEKKYPATDPSHNTPPLQPVVRPPAPANDPLNSVADFMPKKSATSGGTRTVSGPKTKKSFFKGWNLQK
ncbi:MAG: hypothetical protein IT395_06085 [Candidatus Omnitrophica bacterium]|nr:hypothetical protein [Candidatus Omnitrophota bacterium]